MFLTVFRERDLAQLLAKKISNIMCQEETWNVMHVCGTHEDTLCRWGIRSLLPKNLRLISGPGCPVCITPTNAIDSIIALANQDIGILTFGDMVQVPSTNQSLADLKKEGKLVEIVYGFRDAIQIAKENNKQDYVFFSPGFETTAPMSAIEIQNGLPENLSVYSVHRLVPPALEQIMQMKDVPLDAFILPGHVSVIIGMKPYQDFTKKFPIPSVVTGFEPIDMLQGILRVVELLEKKKAIADNVYTRVVKTEGNKKALAVLNDVFEIVDGDWRGLGNFPNSAYKIRDKYSSSDAKKKYDIPPIKSQDIPDGCSCHHVIVGRMIPEECPLFQKKCTPEKPVGPCMVGHEGTCAIRARYFFKK